MPTYTEFAQAIKKKYPEYSKADDSTLAEAMIKKFPQYKDKVDFTKPSEPSVPKLGPLEYKQGPMVSTGTANDPSRLSQFITKDYPEIDKRITERTRATGRDIAAPTWAGNALGLSEKPLMIEGQSYDTRNTLQKLGEGVVGAPERALRTGIGAASYGLDALMGGGELALKGINRLAAGAPGRVLESGVKSFATSPVGQGLGKAVGAAAATAPGKYLYRSFTEEPTDPATAANWRTVRRAVEVTGALAVPPSAKPAIKATQAGVKATGSTIGKPIAAAGKAYEEFGIKKVPSVIKTKQSLLEQVEGKDLKEKAENFSRTIADYNLQGDLRKPGRLAEKADQLGNQHVKNADDQLKLAEFFGDVKIKPYDELVTRVGSVQDYAPFGKTPRYKTALKNLLKELEDKGYGPGVEVPITEIKKIKQLIRPQVWKHGEVGHYLDPPMDDIQKRMTISLNDAASDLAPEAKTYRYENTQAKKLFNIAKIAKDDEYKALIKQQKKPLGDVLKTTLGAGTIIPGASWALNQMAKSGVDPMTLGALGGIGAGAGLIASGGAKAVTSPRVAIPVGRGVKNLGLLLQGEQPVIRAGAKKPFQPYEGQYLKDGSKRVYFKPKYR
jgi:hypothetical protein